MLSRILLLLCLLAATANAKTTVHLICHTHDDVGWLKTVDQCYSGFNKSIHADRKSTRLNSSHT